MDLTMFLFLLAVLPGSLTASGMDMHFAGGSMMFEFIDTSKAPYKIKITTLTGWVLGLGPCGKACSAADVGQNTTHSRQQILNLNGETYLGNWTKRVKTRRGEYGKYSIMTNEINQNIVGLVTAVNVPMKWEQELAEVVVDIDPTSLYDDISFHGSFWRMFNYTDGMYSYPVDYWLKIRVYPVLRNDTKQPNNSPRVLFKPVYKILLNTATTIKLSTTDPDGDITRCTYPYRVDYGFINTLNNTVINPDCSIVIDAQESSGFVDGGWGAIGVKVMEIGINPKENPFYSLWTDGPGAITVQFMIQTLKTIDSPEFVDPTQGNGHEFIVYVGSTLKIPLYANTSNYSVSNVDTFQLRSIPPRSFSVDVIKDDASRLGQHVKYSIATWSPGKSDVGEYLVGALVTDTQGLDGFDRNYKVIVKDMELVGPTNIPHTGPFFVQFPHSTGIVCMIDSTCSFPIYANTKTASGIITSVKYTTSTFPFTTISSPTLIIKDGASMFVSDVTVQALTDGEQRICLEATDNQWKRSEIKCVVVQVQLQDPCKSNPCVSGICSSQDQIYECSCTSRQTGKHCEKDIHSCASIPCLNNGKCIPRYRSYSCDCLGTGYIGFHCETAVIDCNVGICGQHGVCKYIDGKQECECFSGYTGDHCDTIDSECVGVTCENGGICILEGIRAVCKCPLGFTGTRCSRSHSTPQVNSGANDNAFTVPSLPNGAQLQCFVDIPIVISLYTKTPINRSPDINVGLHSHDVSASITSTTSDPTTGTVKSLLSITPHKTGVHIVCVTSGSSNPDNLCYKVDADIYIAHPIDKFKLPLFKSPTPPEHSMINCIQGKPCHAIITSDIGVSQKCALFSRSTSAIVFKVLKSASKCETNVLFIPPATGYTEVCLQAGPLTHVRTYTFQGEGRCFLLKTSATDYCNPNPCANGGACVLQPGESPTYQCICPDTATGDRCQYQNSCFTSPCKNGGFCEIQGHTYDCKCPIGYEGRNCDPLSTTSEAEFTDPTLNNGATVECEVGAKCIIPVFVRGPSSQLFEGPISGDVDVNLWKRVGKVGAFHNEDLLEVTATQPGKMKVCLKTQTIFSSRNQIICYHIRAIAGKNAMQNDGFKTPTLPSGTTIPCAKAKRCHIVMFSQPDHNMCQQVEGQGELNVHIFPSKLEGGSCLTDVLFSSDVSTGLNDLCLRTGSSPQRCYKVDPNTTEPCKNQNCGDGACIVEGDNFSCVYDDKHQGPACNGESCPPIIG